MSRKLTEKEQKRSECFDATAWKLKRKGYIKSEQTVSIKKANLLAPLVALPSIAGFTAWFLLRNGFEPHFTWLYFVLFMAAYIVCLPLHEFIHGFTWSRFVPERLKSIEFGFIKETGTPYCYCSEPLAKGEYLLGSFMPCFMLGILPCFAGIFLNSVFLLLLGLVNIVGAGGDLLVDIKLLSYKTRSRSVLYMDHPTECGFIVFEK